MKKFTIIIISLFYALLAHSQIGYQVSLLNKATGEPRANETVSVDIKITDSKDNIIFSGSQSATTNDFGVLSLSVGKENTFDNVDWNNLPLFVSATVDNVLLGCSQILSVPVAEYAKQTGTLTKDILKSKTWVASGPYGNSDYLSFSDSKMTWKRFREGILEDQETNNYYIWGNFVMCNGEIYCYIPEIESLFFNANIYK